MITCHGLSAGGPSLDFSVDTARTLLDVNFIGNFVCARAAAKEFQRNGKSGSIVLIASMSAHGSNKVGKSLRKSKIVLGIIPPSEEESSIEECQFAPLVRRLSMLTAPPIDRA